MFLHSAFLLLMASLPLTATPPTIPQASDSTTLRVIFPSTLCATQLPEELLAMFKEAHGIPAFKISLCTGDADNYLRSKNPERIDVVIGHQREIEDKLLADGYVTNIRELLYSNFVLAGPKDDPAKIRGIKDPLKALRIIAQKKANFFSRGDNSGTHGLEKAMWQLAKIQPKGDWYITTYTGTDATLVLANKKKGYTIAHYPTFIQQQETLDMEIMVDGNLENKLITKYEVMAVHPQKFPNAHYVDAMTFIGFLTSPNVQEYIAHSGIEQFGRQTNFPLAVDVEVKAGK